MWPVLLRLLARIVGLWSLMLARIVALFRSASTLLNPISRASWLMPPPRTGTAQLFSGSATGVVVQLQDWRYPVVFATETGEARYDNFSGRWGNQAHLDTFLQSYAAEKCKIEGRKQGHTVMEQQLADGSIKLTVNVRGTN
mgnify:CR=1 FL=1